MLKAQASESAALGDTVKTSMGELRVPMKVKRIIGIWGYAIGGPGQTTLENISGILELESPDINLAPLQLPLDIISVLTEGSSVLQTRIFGCNIPVKGGEKITGYMTLDMAITLANTGRWGLLYDG